MSLSLDNHPDTGRFLLLLKKISDQATEEHVQTMVFLLRQKITRKNAEKCKKLLDIFDLLIKKTLLTPDDMEYMENIVRDTWGDDFLQLKPLFDEYYGVAKPVPNKRHRAPRLASNTGSSPMSTFSTLTSDRSKSSPSTASSYSLRSRETSSTCTQNISERFMHVFEYTALHLESDWLVLARLMEIPEGKVSDIAKIGGVCDNAMSVMRIWYHKQSRPSVTEFRKLLKLIPRNDISDDIREMMQKEQVRQFVR